MKIRISLLTVILLASFPFHSLFAQAIFFLSGTVTDASTSEPIFEAWIDIYSGGIPQSYLTAADGSYGGWNTWATEIDVVCSKEGYHPAIIRIHPTVEDNTIDFKLIPVSTSATNDYNGDGTTDIAIFRPETGLIAIRNISRFYFGGPNDNPIPEDYNGDGTTDFAILREETRLWAIRKLTRIYFGTSTDIPAPGDYDGDGCCDVGIFRNTIGRWYIRGITKVYFGTTGDIPH